MRVTKAVAATIIALIVNSEVFAQGCAMCKNGISTENGAEMAATLNTGILALLIPVVCILSAIIVVVYRFRNA